MVIEIVIKPSHLQNKKYDAVIDDKKTIPFGQRGASDYTIKMMKEKKDISIDIRKMKIGIIFIQQVFGADGSYGINHQLVNQLEIQIIDLKM